MKHLNSEAYGSVTDKNIDKKIMQKLKNTQKNILTYSYQKNKIHLRLQILNKQFLCTTKGSQK